MPVVLFPQLPEMRPPVSGDTWVVCEDWLGPKLGGWSVRVAEGFRTDGATIPRVMWRAVGHPLQVPLLGPALAHDAMYAGEMCGRKEADGRFLEAMRQAGIGWLKRRAVWAAVRCFGWAVWRGHSRDSVAQARELVKWVPV